MPEVSFDGDTLVLRFFLDTFDGTQGELRFSGCWRWRLGETNDEGWYRKQCRFSLVAPAWGEFYEVIGDIGAELLPEGSWTVRGEAPPGSRHFLFYFRDETFEGDALAWSYRVLVD